MVGLPGIWCIYIYIFFFLNAGSQWVNGLFNESVQFNEGNHEKPFLSVLHLHDWLWSNVLAGPKLYTVFVVSFVFLNPGLNRKGFLSVFFGTFILFWTLWHRGTMGSTIRTLLPGKSNPKDWQVLSLGDVGFLLFLRLVSGDYGKPWTRIHDTHKG